MHNVGVLFFHGDKQKEMEILRTESLVKDFPGVRALDQLDFTLEKGEIHGIVGENGAGKSTLVKVLSGVYTPTAGRIFYQEKEVVFHSPRDAQNMVGVVHQELELVPFFTGVENLFLGQELSRRGFLRFKEMRLQANKFASSYNLPVDLQVPVRALSSGQQVLVTILKVLFRKPPIIIFDEPTASLSVKETESLFKLIRDLKKNGISILYISHNLQEVLSLCERITVLRNGKKVITAISSTVNELELIRHMIAKELAHQYPKQNLPIGNEIFRLENYSNRQYRLSNINIRIHAGEIVGFAGLVGAGRTELAKAIFTASPVERGKIFLQGKLTRFRNPHEAVQRGIVMIPEKRREEGIINNMNVEENLTLSSLPSLSRKGFKLSKRIEEFASQTVSTLSIKIVSLKQGVTTLSGGNQQKVSLGKWFKKHAILWIFDEPTQGIDVETKTEIYAIMGELASKGAGIWFISSDLRELTAISDRIYIMWNRSIVLEVQKPFDTERILKAMHGRGDL
mgnify:CR=1 FL=1